MAQAIFLLLAFSLVLFFRDRPQFHTLGIIFVSIVLEAFPFMLLGTLIGGFIEVFVSQETITRFLPERRWWSVFIAAGLGVIFPVCECAIVPVIRRLLKKGVPLSAAIAFLLGGPIVNPLVAALHGGGVFLRRVDRDAPHGHRIFYCRCCGFFNGFLFF